MAERQIAFASVWFTRDGQHITAHRGDRVDIPADEIKRLEGLGALVPVGGELERPGVLLKLPDDPSPARLDNYLASGGIAEILTQAEDYPIGLVDKLLAAEKAGQNRDQLVAGLQARVTGGQAPVLKPRVPSDPALVTDEHLATLLEGSVKEVLAKATEQPLLAERLRLAEEAKGNDARKSLVEGLSKITAPTV